MPFKDEPRCATSNDDLRGRKTSPACVDLAWTDATPIGLSGMCCDSCRPGGTGGPSLIGVGGEVREDETAAEIYAGPLSIDLRPVSLRELGRAGELVLGSVPSRNVADVQVHPPTPRTHTALRPTQEGGPKQPDFGFGLGLGGGINFSDPRYSDPWRQIWEETVEQLEFSDEQRFLNEERAEAARGHTTPPPGGPGPGPIHDYSGYAVYEHSDEAECLESAGNALQQCLEIIAFMERMGWMSWTEAIDAYFDCHERHAYAREACIPRV